MTAKLQAALQQLDVANDNHWTSDGLARLETVRLLAGDQSLTREALLQAAPGFTRATPTLQRPEVPGKAPQAPAKAAEAAPAASPTTPAAAAPSGPETQERSDAQPADPGEETALQAAQRVHDAALRESEAAAAELAQARALLDREVEKTAATDAAASSLVSAVTHYHARQIEIMEERAARREALKHVDLKEILPSRSAIDDALSRRRGQRGSQRPAFPRK